MVNEHKAEIRHRCFKAFQVKHVNPLLTRRRHDGWCIKMDTMNAEDAPRREINRGMFETLMRNMAFPEDDEAIREEQKPCWEQEQPRTEQSVEIRVPQNAAELLTLQSRRILLKRSEEGKSVTGYEVLGGDYWSPENAFAEQMTLWRKTSKENEKVTYMPQQHDASIQLWREFPTMLNPEEHKPGVLSWNLRLQNAGLLGSKEQICLKTIGIQYDEQGASVKDSYSDQLSMQLALLDNLGDSWTPRINREVERCVDAANCIGMLAKELKLAGGLDYNRVKTYKDLQKVTESARSQFYFAVDQPFRQWLRSIDPEEDDMTETTARWQVIARGIAEQLGQQMVLEAGSAALVGHRVKLDAGKKTERMELYTAPKAYNRFRAGLYKLYPKTNDEGGTA